MGTFLLIFVASPVYFLIRGKWLGFIFNSVLYVLALVFLMVGIGVIFWALAVLHGGLAYQKEREEKNWKRQQRMMDEQATATANRLAAALQPQPSKPESPSTEA